MRVTRISRRTQVTLTMVLGLVLAFAYATYLSGLGSKNLQDAFTYQTAVVAAQRDSSYLQVEQFERGAPPEELAPDEALLKRDLGYINANAETPAEKAPTMTFPGTRRSFEVLTEELVARQNAGKDAFDTTVSDNEKTRNLSNAMFAIVALLFALVVGRLRRAIERGRSIVERLQRAFISAPRALPNVDIGSVLISATRGSNVGGDTYDAFTFDGDYGVFLVADVSGKGIDAAVDTALIKYTIRTLFSQDHDPARILGKFASIYARTAENPETFVVLFLAIVDLQAGLLQYASAGHEPAWVVHGGSVEQLPPTGAIVGIAREENYVTQTITLAPGDALVVSTDGLTESRDARGELLGADNVRDWLSGLSGSAQVMADAIVRRLRKRSRRITDDLAILVVRYDPVTVVAPAVAGPTELTLAARELPESSSRSR